MDNNKQFVREIEQKEQEKRPVFNAPSDKLTRDIKSIAETKTASHKDELTGELQILDIDSDIIAVSENVLNYNDLTTRRVLNRVFSKINMTLPYKKTTAETVNQILPTREIILSVTEMLELCQQKNATKMYKSIVKASDFLQGLKVTFKPGQKEKERGVLLKYAPIIDEVNIYKGGAIGFVFRQEALIYYANTELKTMHDNYFLININSHPHSQPIYEALTDHYRINAFKNNNNKNKLSIKALIKQTPALNETYQQEIKKETKKRHVKDKVIKPLLRDLDELVLQNMINFKLVEKAETPLIANKDYEAIPTNTFLNMYIVYELKEAGQYPTKAITTA